MSWTSSLEMACREYEAKFPFIKPWVTKMTWMSSNRRTKYVPKIRVQQLDYDLLISEPYDDYGAPACRYFLIDTVDRPHDWRVAEVRPPMKDYSGRRWWKPWTWSGRQVPAETVGDSIITMAEENRSTGLTIPAPEFEGGMVGLTHVVEVSYHEHQITIYKLPKGISLITLSDLAGFIQREQDRARQKLLAGIRQEIQTSD